MSRPLRRAGRRTVTSRCYVLSRWRCSHCSSCSSWSRPRSTRRRASSARAGAADGA